MSPLLFTLAIEPVAVAVSLFADDIMFFLTNLKNSILMRLIGDFGEKINNSKLVIMFLNKEDTEDN